MDSAKTNTKKQEAREFEGHGMDQMSAHLDRGWDLVGRGDISGALLAAQKSIELNGRSPEAHNLFGYVCTLRGQHEDALEHYALAVEFDDTYIDAMLNAAEVWVHPLGDYDRAQSLAEDALECAQTDDERTHALLIKFEISLGRGDNQQAQELLGQIPKGPFANPQLHLMLGRAFLEARLLENSEEQLKKALEHGIDTADLHYYWGVLFDTRNQNREAIVAFLKCRELDAKSPARPWSLNPAQFEHKVQSAIQSLSIELRDTLEGALVIVAQEPGIEAVAEGMDPRTCIYFRSESQPNQPPKQLFIYQRNLERSTSSMLDIEEELVRQLTEELGANNEREQSSVQDSTT